MSTNSERPDCSALFANPSHFRSDCRMLARAAREGWVSPADRPDLIRRLDEAETRWELGPRHILALAQARLALLRAIAEPPPEPGSPPKKPGPPRRKRRATQTSRVDLDAIQRAANRPVAAVVIEPTDDAGERQTLHTQPRSTNDNTRRSTPCPICQRPASTLYPVRGGVACWRCAEVRHDRA